MRKLISINDIDSGTLAELIHTGQRLKKGELDFSRELQGRAVGLYFSKPSTRTRTSFFRAVKDMGGDCIFYSSADLQLGNGESLEDTGMMLGLYLDALVIRTNECFSDMYRLFESAGGMPVINALSEEEHPTQAIADLLTVQEEFGELAGRHLFYLGAANNTLGSLVLAASKLRGVRMTVLTPKAFSLEEALMQRALRNASESGATVEFRHDIRELPRRVDVVYTTRWESMGEEPDVPDWRSHFQGFKVTRGLMREVCSERAIFMHDLPATRGSEVENEVMDGASSRIRRQAFNKAISAMVTLKWCTPRQRPPMP